MVSLQQLKRNICEMFQCVLFKVFHSLVARVPTKV
jgi:hypothetical protein